MKHRLRRTILRQRRSHHPGKKAKKEIAIARRLLRCESLRAARSVLVYLTHKSEVSTDNLIKILLQKKTVIVPRIHGTHLRLCHLENLENLRRGAFGIRYPIPCTPYRGRIDCILVPGIAFDITGHRIGYGKGYYDRLLKKVRATTIGLAYEFQIVDKIPASSYDVPVDYIITEKRTIPCLHYRNKTTRSTRFS